MKPQSKVIQSQEKQILIHLKTGKTINPLQALNQFGCFRLGARIFDIKEIIKESGSTIKVKMVLEGNKRFAEYKLVKPKKK